jgi:teichuronic acid biosynthesis glycosyltransferase TuaH
MTKLHTVALISLEPWDDTWRRNQHLASRLVRLGYARKVLFVCPPTKLRHRTSFSPEEGVSVIWPHLVLPRRAGGLQLLALELRARLRGIDALWVNDAPLGVRCLRAGIPTVYDVTDDWRSSELPQSDRSALVAAEDRLAELVDTVVCSEVLRVRWRDRYGISPSLVQNGVDTRAHEEAIPFELPGRSPHVLYVGTLHHERLDIDLVVEAAHRPQVGTVHLVGPDLLDDASSRRLRSVSNIELHGPISHLQVPAWMASADVLICPHVVSPFTLSLDAIKSFEYLASGRAIVATPTSGFQSLGVLDGLEVVASETFPSAVGSAASQLHENITRETAKYDWSRRASEFAEALVSAKAPG